jgi:hypothetical protein
VLVVIDGPEKSGKSTLIAALAAQLGPTTRIRKWSHLGDAYDADKIYADALREDMAAPGVVLWDRSWACGVVYGTLLGRNNRITRDPWISEWLYGRGVDVKVILGGPHPSVLASARTSDDLPVDPAEEQRAFVEYGRRYGWYVVPPTNTEYRFPLLKLVQYVVDRIDAAPDRDPTAWCGPFGSSVVFVGERRSTAPGLPGAWLPFTSKYTTQYGRILGDAALRCGWTNMADDPRRIFDTAQLVVACGHHAAAWAKEVKAQSGSSTRILGVLHPAALYRWGNLSKQRADVERTIHAAVGEYIPLDPVGSPGNVASPTHA